MIRNGWTAVLIGLSLLMAGCAEAPQRPGYAITPEAAQALASAQADVKESQYAKNAWTTAIAALKDAEKAAAKGDSAAVIRLSTTASELAKESIEQTRYPLVQ